MIKIKIKSDYIKRKIGSKDIVVPINDASNNINGIIELNSSASFLWDMLMSETSTSDLINALISKYSIEKSLAQYAVDSFLSFLLDQDILQ